METLTADLTEYPQAIVLALKGEARIDVRPMEIGCMKASAAHPNVAILDLAELTFISSLAMGLIVSLRGGLRRRGGKLLACNLQPAVLDCFMRARLHEIFEMHPTLPDALDAANALIKRA